MRKIYNLIFALIFFGKTKDNVKKNRNIKLVTTERRRNYLVSEPNYHNTKFSTKNLLAIEMRKTKMLMNSLFINIKCE